MNNLYNSGKVIINRYQIIDLLGKGGIAKTYRAIDLEHNNEVAIKTICLQGIEDWKNLELFQREAQVLQQLNHPNIPKYIDYFEFDTEQERYFYLVQELAPGKSLDELIADGWCPNEQEVKDIAVSILNILIYLQQLTPPIIHRDIKPQNIILHKNKRVYLVDFGAVADVYQHTFNSTIVGTFGYMSPEQYRGQATLATDIYGLGATLLFLLTKKSPAELPQRYLKINFRPYIKAEPHFADWLEKCVEPNPHQRFKTARDALVALQRKTYFKSTSITYQLKGSPVKLIDKEDKLLMVIPPVWNRSLYSLAFSILPWLWYGVTFLILTFIFLNLDVSLIITLILQISSWIFVAFFILTTLYFIFLYPYYGFSKKKILIAKKYLKKNSEIDCNIIINYPQQAKLIKRKAIFSKNYISYCLLYGELKDNRFGHFLTRRENEWLVREINSFLGVDECARF